MFFFILEALTLSFLISQFNIALLENYREMPKKLIILFVEFLFLDNNYINQAYLEDYKKNYDIKRAYKYNMNIIFYLLKIEYMNYEFQNRFGFQSKNHYNLYLFTSIYYNPPHFDIFFDI